MDGIDTFWVEAFVNGESESTELGYSDEGQDPIDWAIDMFDDCLVDNPDVDYVEIYQ